MNEKNLSKILIDNNKDIKFDIYGYNFRNPVWSESFYSAISRSSMAINLNRGKPKKYSSSNRIGSLIGNGLLTFIDYKKKFNHFFSIMKLSSIIIIKIFQKKLFSTKNTKEKRERIARNGQNKYFRLFNEIEVADYIIKRSLKNDKFKPIWEKFIK